MIKAGADVNATDEHGWTARHAAELARQPDAISALIKDKDGLASLHVAVLRGNTAISALLKAGASVVVMSDPLYAEKQMLSSLN